jgi:signal transduction histidine kinase
MDELIRDLLAYGRLIHLEIQLGPVDLDAVARTVLDRMAPELSSRDAAIRLEGSLGWVRGNNRMLVQVLSNLLSNAVKFVPRGTRPQVTLSSERSAGRVRLSVQDNGIGIAPEFQKRIFGIFQRLNREEEYPGTGIGLPIVRKALERMGGSVGVTSVPGQGSRFWIELRDVAAP